MFPPLTGLQHNNATSYLCVFMISVGLCIFAAAVAVVFVLDWNGRYGRAELACVCV